MAAKICERDGRVKRDLVQRQKRPSIETNERGMVVSKESWYRDKKDLLAYL